MPDRMDQTTQKESATPPLAPGMGGSEGTNVDWPLAMLIILALGHYGSSCTNCAGGSECTERRIYNPSRDPEHRGAGQQGQG